MTKTEQAAIFRQLVVGTTESGANFSREACVVLRDRIDKAEGDAFETRCHAAELLSALRAAQHVNANLEDEKKRLYQRNYYLEHRGAGGGETRPDPPVDEQVGP